jgi:hypothetical protein
VDSSTQHLGSSAGSPGLNALDEEREASLADEGGASGAAVERQDFVPARRDLIERPAFRLGPFEPRRPGLRFWILAGAMAAGALAALALRRRH